MAARFFMREHISKEKALIDLEPLLVALLQRCLIGKLARRRDNSRQRVPRGIQKRVHSEELAATIGQPVVELRDMGPKKRLSTVARHTEDCFSRALFCR